MSSVTEAAQVSDQEMQVTLIPVNKIYSDAFFNCRGPISPMDVIDLARSIQELGLQQPVVVRPRIPTTPPQFDYVLVSGHRRHAAYQVNQSTEIPAIIKHNLDDFQARTLNAIENLKRQNLNVLQEARTVQVYWEAGWVREDIARVLQMSPGWVQIRCMVLELPEEIQQAIAAGLIGQVQIRDLYQLRNDPEKQLDTARKLKEARERGDKRAEQIVAAKAVANPNAKKARKKTEIYDMIQHIMTTFGGSNLASRALAWAGGEISSAELTMSLRAECQKLGIQYIPPQE